ncbi:hypothetical protein [Devosia sp.]|uniref:hypothetical protein n=1 Tax=Devosia sp. TaxID=1871048 RepID=UPI0032642688
MTLFKTLIAAALMFTGTSTAFAQFASPVGLWEIEMRDSRYDVAMCGPNNSQLCATLVWLGNGADSPENLPYMNTLLIDHAPPAGPGKWRGKLHIYGQNATGTITQINDNQFSLKGCALLIICKTYQMYRYTK